MFETKTILILEWPQKCADAAFTNAYTTGVVVAGSPAGASRAKAVQVSFRFD